MRKVILIGMLLISVFGFSQDRADEDIKVGLVLSGGGAKGLAHIGALKVIEESGIRIDYIGGTSMGAVIGALYASGYTATQLDSIVSTLDFNTLIQDEVLRSAKTYYERDQSEKYALTLPFDKFQVKFPSALSKGQNVYNLFSKLLSHVNTIEDFNELPIPFFCVATNIETGRETILDKGYLPRAITASGAIPTLFSPVEIKDSLYVDGGVVNNYPVDEVRAMGADIIIGIDVQDSLKMREELRSAFDILVQTNNYRTIENMKNKREKTDLYIHPKVKGYTVVSFDESENIMKAGFEQAVLYKNELAAIAEKQKPHARETIEKHFSDSLYIKEVDISGNKNYTRAYVLGKLKLRSPAATSYKRFSEGVNNLSATGNFQDISYRFYKDEKGETTVSFNLRESDSKLLLRLGAHYDNLYKTAALVNITRKRIFTNNEIVSLDVLVGDKTRYDFNYYIDKGFYWSVGFNSRYNSFSKNVSVEFIFDNEIPEEALPLNQIDFNFRDLTNQLFVQTLFRRSYLLRMGVEHKWLKYFTNTIGIDEHNNPRTVFEDTNYFSAYGTLLFDTYDNKYFPKRGFYLEGDFHLYLFSNGMFDDIDQYSIAKAQLGFAQRLFKNLSMVISTEGGVKIGGSSIDSLDFFLGGYGFKRINNNIPFLGYDALELRGDTYVKSTLDLNYEVYPKTYIVLSANIANVGDRLFTSSEWIDGIDYTGYALGASMDTFIGPVEAKYSYSPELDEGEWYVSVGFRF
jgi:NTE family protein